MQELPTDLTSLCAVVFLLGMRHGFDADHLATIDGLTRLNQRSLLGFGRWCGVLFSLGHGAVVTLIACLIGFASDGWKPPGWFEGLGSAISITFLIGLGLLNLRAVLYAAPGQIVAPVGFKARYLRRFTQVRGPLGVTAVGILFAFSFDTLSQSALFAATASQIGGVEGALMLSGLFTLGMLVTDGLNGWWMGRLVSRTDQLAAIASQVMSAVVACVSLLVGTIGLFRWLSPVKLQWVEDYHFFVGVGVVLSVAAGYFLAMKLARRA